MTEILIDTNVLVYSCDLSAPQKKDKAREVLLGLQSRQQGGLSIQSLAEFVNVIARGKLPVLSLAEAESQADYFLRTFPVFPITPNIVRQAIRAVRSYSLSYYDAQIWACAHLHQTPTIFSEDFQDGLVLEGVRFVNPFAENFELEKWI
ncbi:MAG: PIN domain nuclease [Anaerolineales bacterium]